MELSIREIENKNRGTKKMKRQEMEKLDIDKYVGEDTTIISAVVEEGKFGKAIKLTSDVIPFKEKDSLPDDKVLRATKYLGLQENENGEIYIGIESKADKWLNGKKIDVEKDFPEQVVTGTRLEALEGLKVKVQKNQNGFLEIA